MSLLDALAALSVAVRQQTGDGRVDVALPPRAFDSLCRDFAAMRWWKHSIAGEPLTINTGAGEIVLTARKPE